MKRISPPKCSASELFDDCVQEISDPELRLRFIQQKSLVEAQNAIYALRSQDQTWFHLPMAAHGHDEQTIVGNLSKGELVNLYTSCMVNSNGPARKKYDQIMLLSQDECPYCGGCGEMVNEEGIGTLDHFLPKAKFPVFSILPENLVPACGTCNKKMAANFSTDENLQPLHPYFDATHIFEKKWTTAIVLEEFPVTVNFGVDLPQNWSDKDKCRVVNHFVTCGFRGRYRSKVASDISSLIDLRRTVHRDLTPEAFREILKVVADNKNLPINGWKRTLHHGLSESEWFCRNDFVD